MFRVFTAALEQFPVSRRPAKRPCRPAYARSNASVSAALPVAPPCVTSPIWRFSLGIPRPSGCRRLTTIPSSHVTRKKGRPSRTRAPTERCAPTRRVQGSPADPDQSPNSRGGRPIRLPSRRGAKLGLSPYRGCRSQRDVPCSQARAPPRTSSPAWLRSAPRRIACCLRYSTPFCVGARDPRPCAARRMIRSARPRHFERRRGGRGSVALQHSERAVRLDSRHLRAARRRCAARQPSMATCLSASRTPSARSHVRVRSRMLTRGRWSLFQGDLGHLATAIAVRRAGRAHYLALAARRCRRLRPARPPDLDGAAHSHLNAGLKGPGAIQTAKPSGPAS